MFIGWQVFILFPKLLHYLLCVFKLFRLISPVPVEPALLQTWMKYYCCPIDRGSVGLSVVLVSLLLYEIYVS